MVIHFGTCVYRIDVVFFCVLFKCVMVCYYALRVYDGYGTYAGCDTLIVNCDVKLKKGFLLYMSELNGPFFFHILYISYFTLTQSSQMNYEKLMEISYWNEYLQNISRRHIWNVSEEHTVRWAMYTFRRRR